MTSGTPEISAYAAASSWASGLSRYFRAADCTSEGRRPSRKTFTTPSVCGRTRRNCHHFSTMSAHETIENRSRTPSTALAIGPAFQRISRTPVFKESEVDTRAPLDMVRRYRSRVPSDHTKRIADLSNFCRTFAGLAHPRAVDLAGARPV